MANRPLTAKKQELLDPALNTLFARKEPCKLIWNTKTKQYESIKQCQTEKYGKWPVTTIDGLKALKGLNQMQKAIKCQ